MPNLRFIKICTTLTLARAIPFKIILMVKIMHPRLKIVFLAVVIAVVLGSSLYVSLVILPATEKQEALDKFKALRKGMSYEEMITIVGEPNQDIGSGIHVYLYKLPDGTEVIVGVGEGLMYVKQKISNDTYVDLIQ